MRGREGRKEERERWRKKSKKYVEGQMCYHSINLLPHGPCNVIY